MGWLPLVNYDGAREVAGRLPYSDTTLHFGALSLKEGVPVAEAAGREILLVWGLHR